MMRYSPRCEARNQILRNIKKVLATDRVMKDIIAGKIGVPEGV
jgi:hypothetical protein